jgi:hypothetical protein
MTATVEAPPAWARHGSGEEGPARDQASPRSWRERHGRKAESALVFVAFFAVYFLIGRWVVVDLHLVNFDAISRLAHAFFVWHNDPPKLAAIGFIWPPMQTLAFLPAALFKPLATSLAALPLTSALFMAATMVVLNRALEVGELRWFARWPLLVLFGLNPMIVYYGANGMAEAVYLFFLTAGVYFFLRWSMTRRTHLLAFVGLALAFGILSRYELVPFGLVIAAAIAAVTLSDRQKVYRPQELEGSLLLYAAPVAYAGGAWLFFNWLILGNPAAFLEIAPTSADIGVSGQDVGGLAARDLGVVQTADFLLTMNWALFPLSVLVGVALIVSAVVKRSVVAVALAALIATNALVTLYLFVGANDPNLMQLRYNMRAMPLAIIGVAWLFYLWRERGVRIGLWAAVAVVLAVSLPLTWKTMSTYTYQYEENLFLRAVATGEDQEGNAAIGGYPIGIADERAMADQIEEVVGEDDVIATDDAQTLGVMLLSGEPGKFLDRIDQGDGAWRSAVETPYGDIDYLLVSTDERCRFPCLDQVRGIWPDVLKGDEPGMTPVFETRQYVLVKVDETPPNDAGPAE